MLTEPRHFLGCEEHVREVRDAVSLPVLRKDFMCDSYQLHEASAWGADLILLIVAALDPHLMRDLYEEAVSIGLEVLVESHTGRELEKALELEAAIVGVNSRNLKTLKTDLAVARELASEIPEGRYAIAESGIKTRADIDSLLAVGYQGFLIGESLLKEGEPGENLALLIG